MKRTAVMILLLVTCCANTKAVGKERQVRFMRQLATYNPAARFLLEGERGQDAILNYSDGNSAENWLRDFSTVVHERYHGWEFRYGLKLFGDGYKVFLLDPEIIIPVERLEQYNTSVLHQEVDQEIRDSIFRYKPYIYDGPNSKMGSQVHGMYGLMEEWNAYYLGSKAMIDLENYFLTRDKGLDDLSQFSAYIGDYISAVASEINAHYEFKLFMAWYLTKARKDYPDQYQAMMGQTSLRVAFTLIDDAFDELVAVWMEKINRVCIQYSRAGQVAAVTETGIEFSQGPISVFFGMFWGEMEYLKQTFAPYEGIFQGFKIQGLTSSNWRNYMPEGRNG